MAVNNFAIHSDLAALTQELESQTRNDQGNGYEGVVLFFSFDIVNATGYKAKNKEKWVDVLSEILRHIISSFSNTSSGGYRFWKTLGDEIIYTKEITKMEDVIDTMQTVYGILRMLNQQIADGMLCDAESGKVLGVKAAAWIAHIANSGAAGDNLFTEYLINDNRKQTEYIGPDIDIGFRVAGHSIHNHMVISFSLAEILLKYDTSKKKRVHLFAYKQLKGVWEGRPHPIIMFHSDPNADLIAELEQVQLAPKEKKNEYLTNLKTWHLDDNYSEEEIFAEIAEIPFIANKVKRIVDTIQRDCELPNHNLKPFSKVFYSALCHKMVNGEIAFFLAKKKNEEKWRFGGDIMYHNFAYMSTIKEYYQETFGLEFDFIRDENHHNFTPLVLSTYPLEKPNLPPLKATVFLAEIKNELSNLSIHSDWDVQLLTLDEIVKFDEPFVDEFSSILETATKFLSKK